MVIPSWSAIRGTVFFSYGSNPAWSITVFSIKIGTSARRASAILSLGRASTKISDPSFLLLKNSIVLKQTWYINQVITISCNTHKRPFLFATGFANSFSMDKKCRVIRITPGLSFIRGFWWYKRLLRCACIFSALPFEIKKRMVSEKITASWEALHFVYRRGMADKNLTIKIAR